MYGQYVHNLIYYDTLSYPMVSFFLYSFFLHFTLNALHAGLPYASNSKSNGTPFHRHGGFEILVRRLGMSMPMSCPCILLYCVILIEDEKLCGFRTHTGYCMRARMITAANSNTKKCNGNE